MGYCQASDVYAFGIPRGSVPFPARLIGAIAAGSDTLELDGHGFAAGDPITFRVESGGSLPSPLIEATTYFADPTDDCHFRVAATVGGAAVDLTTSGSRVLVIAPLPIDSAIKWASGQIDDMVPAAALPMVAPYPPTVVSACAELAAAKLGGLTGSVTKSLGDTLTAVQKRLEKWEKGKPIRGEHAPSPAGLAVSAATIQAAQPSPWDRYGRLR